jgi:uncharacterized protein
MISRRQFLQWFGGLAPVSPAFYGTIVEPSRLVVTRYHIEPNNWPNDLQLKIAAVADIHACEPWMTTEHIQSVVKTTNSLGADLIVLLGDYVASHRFVTGKVDSADWAAILSGLWAPLGVHAILGNHDWWQDRKVQHDGAGSPEARRALEAANIRVYENDVVRLSKDNHVLWLAGLGDQLAFLPSHRKHRRRIGVDDLTGTLRKVSRHEPVILLAHEPDIMPKVPPWIALTLSGHTHGGQLRFFGWSPVVPSAYGNRFAYGHIREQCDLVVSGGLGCSIVPARFGVPPEIVLVTLGAA